MTKAKVQLLLLFLGAIGLAVFMLSGRSQSPIQKADDKFLIYPYLQLGPDHKPGKLMLRWAALSALQGWSVEVEQKGGKWAIQAPVVSFATKNDVLPEYFMFEDELKAPNNLEKMHYRVLHDNQVLFDASSKPVMPGQKKYRFAVAGDCGSPTAAEKSIAFRLFTEHPDMLFIPGDIVYSTGRQTEYLNHFFPIYNSNVPSPVSGGPLMRSTLFVAAPGNHDVHMADKLINVADLNLFADGLAYFVYWRQPLNGIAGADRENGPQINGSKERVDSLKDASRGAFPKMANFSFDYGNAHWTVLDADPYMDWTKPKWHSWLEQDLANSKATWKFVGFHQPPFTTGLHHYREQQMRVLTDLFEKYKVDIVFCGHVHNYQRSYPLWFKCKPGPDGRLLQDDGTIGGDLKLDKTFDGDKNTNASAPIYIVSGGGGAALYTEGTHPGEIWEPFTVKLISNVHSCTICDIDDHKLLLRQMDAAGTVLDQITLTKP